MMGSTIRIGRIMGIDIKIDTSWFIIFALVTWSLAGHYLPHVHSGWGTATYWLIGALTSVLFFASVLAHELAHGAVSLAFGLSVRDITLFIFGGVTRFEREARRPKEELFTSLAGPATSAAIAAVFGVLWWLSRDVSDQVHALAGWLAWINLLLALFNLVPGFPLDGGRVLRAIVWRVTGNARRATVIAAATGEMIALSFLFWGIFLIFSGDWGIGLWIAFIGWFLRSAAQDEARRVVLEDLLTGHTVREVMMTDCPQVPRSLTLDVALDQVVAPSGRRCFPVVEDGRVDGLLTLQRIQRVSRDRWPRTHVAEVMIPAADVRTVTPDDDLGTVFERMAGEDINQFPVVEDGRFLGIVSRDNLLTFLQRQAKQRQAA